MKILLFILFPLFGFGQLKTINLDADSTCTNNYEWYYDTSYSKHAHKIDLDALDFMEWVFENFNRIPKGVTIFKDGHAYKEDTWVRKERGIGNGSTLTSRELWLEWYKLINECWWE